MIVNNNLRPLFSTWVFKGPNLLHGADVPAPNGVIVDGGVLLTVLVGIPRAQTQVGVTFAFQPTYRKKEKAEGKLENSAGGFESRYDPVEDLINSRLISLQDLTIMLAIVMHREV